MDLLVALLLIIITYFIGRTIEKAHFKKIIKREVALIKQPCLNLNVKNWNIKRNIKEVRLVTGEVVISGDYFKNFAAGLKTFFGGRLTTFESILDRARREATLRMREEARNASVIVNVKIESVMLNDIYLGGIPRCAVIAYGTAITYE